jgi:itaconate CoA-transferase
VMDDPSFADDPRFCTNPLRMENRELLEHMIEQHFAPLTSEEVLDRLDRAGIANAHMNSVEAFLDHEQLHRRGRVQEVGSPAGPLISFLPAVTIPGTPPVMGPVPEIGQHTDAILAELGLVKPNP